MLILKKYSYTFLILLLVILLLQGLYNFYFYKVSFYIPFLNYKYTSGISSFIWNENGIVEYLQVFLLIFAIVNFFKILINRTFYKTSSIFIYFIYLYFLGLIYFFLEEISYGQHIFGWNSHILFINLNHQGETNLHNISNLFNEWPRSLLIIWCSLSFIIVKKLEKNWKFKNLALFVFPSKKLKKISILILIFVLPDLVLKKLDLYVEYPSNNTTEHVYFYPFPVEYIENYELFNFFTFNYIKLSELQELLFCFYICMHIIYLDTFKFIKNSS
tara:strand:+ start:2355 stop:3173 length:819 start_codon:yes stop_codon:yes gene_type:complete